MNQPPLTRRQGDALLTSEASWPIIRLARGRPLGEALTGCWPEPGAVGSVLRDDLIAGRAEECQWRDETSLLRFVRQRRSKQPIFFEKAPVNEFLQPHAAAAMPPPGSPRRQSSTVAEIKDGEKALLRLVFAEWLTLQAGEQIGVYVGGLAHAEHPEHWQIEAFHRGAITTGEDPLVGNRM